ncbi:hypothetical protein JTB14_035364 [Gonioctena quinquepunctata]|nr:hypothetical protein JTB14_035364 [Gonioctena quinquepunctata]
MQTILGLINNVSITDTHVKVQRIGKFGNGLNRLLKVTFANSEDAKEVLRSKDKLKPVMILAINKKAESILQARATTCEWEVSDCLTVRVPAGLVTKAGHVPPNGEAASEEKASIPIIFPAFVQTRQDNLSSKAF